MLRTYQGFEKEIVFILKLWRGIFHKISRFENKKEHVKNIFRLKTEKAEKSEGFTKLDSET